MSKARIEAGSRGYRGYTNIRSCQKAELKMKTQKDLLDELKKRPHGLLQLVIGICDFDGYGGEGDIYISIHSLSDPSNLRFIAYNKLEQEQTFSSFQDALEFIGIKKE